jgi:hypothetical protein
MERIDKLGRSCAEANMRTPFRWHRREIGAQIDPEFRIGFAEAHGCGPRLYFDDSDRSEQRFIKAGCFRKISYRD